MKITRAIAQKVLTVVDAGLVDGMGEPEPGKMCVEAAVCYALGLPHGDNPSCVSPALRSLKIALNDKNWSTPAARAQGLRRLAIAQLGSRGALNEIEFVCRVALLSVRSTAAKALRLAASLHDATDKAKLISCAESCERAETLDAAIDAADAAIDAAIDAARDAADAAIDAAIDAARDAASAASDAAGYAASAASAASDAAGYAASAASDEARDAASAASDEARDAASAASDAAGYAAGDDEHLANFAEEVVQILIDMKAPGCEWLDLTEAA